MEIKTKGVFGFWRIIHFLESFEPFGAAFLNGILGKIIIINFPQNALIYFIIIKKK